MMMPARELTAKDREYLLKLARASLENGVYGIPLPEINDDELSPILREPGVTFITLTKVGQLRGCVGALEPYQSLAEDVREHSVASAMQDYRFPPVKPHELDEINIEISRLTTPEKLNYEGPDELLHKIRPGIDGVIIRDGFRRATFLPQVWEKISDPIKFFESLCLKMGASPDLWKHKQLDVQVYQVEEFHEE
jgi:AmmeMemoRadiSam system protein A